MFIYHVLIVEVLVSVCIQELYNQKEHYIYKILILFVNSVAEIISNHYLVRELFWPLEFRIYIFRPMRMIDAILPGSPPWAT